MNVSIVYLSKFGNNKACSEYVAQKLKEKGHQVKDYSVAEIKPDSLPQSDLMIFGSPTHIGGPPFKIQNFAKKAARSGAKYSLLITFWKDPTQTSNKLTAILDAGGMVKVGDGVKIKVAGIRGPLEKGYEKKLDDFVDQLISAASGG